MTKAKGMTVADIIGKGAPYNPRKITDKALDMLGKSMREFGDLSGVVFNRKTGRLVGGHQRLKHLRAEWPIEKMPLTDEVGTVSVGQIITPTGTWFYREVEWDEDKEMAANIAANKHGGEFDLPLLKDLLIHLDTGAFNMELTGFDEAEIADLMSQFNPDEPVKEDTDFDPEAEAAAIVNPITKLGDIWILGRHRLLCGDCTKQEDLDRLMDGKKADLIWIDPPYNVDYQKGVRAIKNDNMDEAVFQKFLTDAVKVLCTITRAGGCLYMAHADQTGHIFRIAMRAGGFKLSQNLIWVKSSAALSRQDYNWKHEPILYGWKPGAGHYFSKDYSQTTVILDEDTDLSKLKIADLLAIVKEYRGKEATTVFREDRPARNDLHPTMKPIALVAKMVRNSTEHSTDQIVVDGFLGSGTTIMACDQIQRTAYGLELDPIFADVIVKRWEQFTGKTAERIAA